MPFSLPLRIAIFASVSSSKQATVDKDSLPSQLRDGRLWADSVAGDVVATFEVAGHSCLRETYDWERSIVFCAIENRHSCFKNKSAENIPRALFLCLRCEQVKPHLRVRHIL